MLSEVTSSVVEHMYLATMETSKLLQRPTAWGLFYRLIEKMPAILVIYFHYSGKCSARMLTNSRHVTQLLVAFKFWSLGSNAILFLISGNNPRPADYSVVFGMHSTSSAGTRMIVQSVSITRHASYNDNTMTSDIAIIGKYTVQHICTQILYHAKIAKWTALVSVWKNSLSVSGILG